MTAMRCAVMSCPPRLGCFYPDRRTGRGEPSSGPDSLSAGKGVGVELPEFDDLRFFAGVAAAGTLTEVARQWGVSVSAVSKRLARLERRLGVRLVNRSTRRPHPDRRGPPLRRGRPRRAGPDRRPGGRDRPASLGAARADRGALVDGVRPGARRAAARHVRGGQPGPAHRPGAVPPAGRRRRLRLRLRGARRTAARLAAARPGSAPQPARGVRGAVVRGPPRRPAHPRRPGRTRLHRDPGERHRLRPLAFRDRRRRRRGPRDGRDDLQRRRGRDGVVPGRPRAGDALAVAGRAAARVGGAGAGRLPFPPPRPRPRDHRPPHRDQHELDDQVDRPRAQQVQRGGVGRLVGEEAVVGARGQVERQHHRRPGDRGRQRHGHPAPGRPHPGAPGQVHRGPGHQQVQRPEVQERDVREVGGVGGRGEQRLRGQRETPVVQRRARPPAPCPQGDRGGDPGQVRELQRQRDVHVEGLRGQQPQLQRHQQHDDHDGERPRDARLGGGAAQPSSQGHQRDGAEDPDGQRGPVGRAVGHEDAGVSHRPIMTDRAAPRATATAGAAPRRGSRRGRSPARRSSRRTASRCGSRRSPGSGAGGPGGLGVVVVALLLPLRHQVRHGDDHRADHDPEDRRADGVGEPAQEPAQRTGRVGDGHLQMVHQVVDRGEAQLVHPDEQDVPADPQHRRDADDRQRRQHDRHGLHQPAPERRDGAGAALRQREAGVVHLHDQRDRAVDERGDRDGDDGQDDRPGHEALGRHLVQRDDHDLGGQDEVGAHGAGDDGLLVLGRVRGDLLVTLLGVLGVPREVLPELLGALVGEVAAAEHEDRGQQPRRELGEDQRDRQDEDDLVDQRAPGDPPDDRQLALGLEPLHVAGGDGGVVDDHTRGLGPGAPGGPGDVVEGGRRQAHQRRDVVEQGEQSAHRVTVRCMAESVRTRGAYGRAGRTGPNPPDRRA
ncbi:hypothetical protein L7F22_008614 [Adiantum nelumboides]|nr:hypothetical protein [Adiantum nelumboides]